MVFHDLKHSLADATCEATLKNMGEEITWIYHDVVSSGHQGPLLLTWFNFSPSMDK